MDRDTTWTARDIDTVPGQAAWAYGELPFVQEAFLLSEEQGDPWPVRAALSLLGVAWSEDLFSALCEVMDQREVWIDWPRQ